MKKLRQLTKNGGDNNHPIWTPNGKEIIFSSERTGNYEIHVMNINGKNLRNLTFLSKKWKRTQLCFLVKAYAL